MHALVEDALQDIAQVRAADNGETGAQLAEQWHPHLILCDMLMPGLNGLETIVRLKMIEDVREVPVILLTGAAEELRSFPALDEMVNGIVAKPFEIAYLRSRVQEILARIGTINSAGPANPPG